MQHRWHIPTMLLMQTAVGVAGAQGFPAFEQAAKHAQTATVTVRVVTTPIPLKRAEEGSAVPAATPKVSVFSGVSLGKGLLVTPLLASTKPQIRVTIAGGKQAKAEPVVLDEHSGLALLKMDRDDVPAIELADAMPKVGGWIISAAGWGVDKPVVSFGMVGGLERSLPGGNYPPLLQCNVTTTESSAGAGIVDQHGKLVGIIVAVDSPAAQRGWAYAVPVKHVRRMLRSVPGEDASVDDKPKSVVVLQRRRPRVGMVLDGNRDEITVVRVERDGPAERAGIKVGDRILAVDGVKIRSVYEAARPTLVKQPGEKATFLVEQADGTRPVEVVLGGGVVVPGVQLGSLFEPKVEIDGLVQRPRATPKFAEAAVVPLRPSEVAKASPQELLKLAIERYLSVIEIQRGQLMRQDRELAEALREIKKLRDENSRLQGAPD